MPSLPREVLEDFVERWLEANRVAEAEGDWKGLADFYTDDATYGWNIGPKEDVMCVGIDEIRNIALGLEMFGLDGWSYPYQKVIIDDKIGEVVGFWKQVATDSEGQQSTIYGIGGSWFRLDADGHFPVTRRTANLKVVTNKPLARLPVCAEKKPRTQEGEDWLEF